MTDAMPALPVPLFGANERAALVGGRDPVFCVVKAKVEPCPLCGKGRAYDVVINLRGQPEAATICENLLAREGRQ